jgi:O-antigen ligase
MTSSADLSIGDRLPNGRARAAVGYGTAAAGAAVVTAALLLGVVGGFGEWPIALALALSLPAAVLIMRFPSAAVLIWLVAAPFVMTTETAGERTVYWLLHRALPPFALATVLANRVLRISSSPLPRLGPAEVAMAGYLAASIFSIAFLNERPLETAYLLYDRVAIPFCLYATIRLAGLRVGMRRYLVPALAFVALTQSIIGLLSWIAPQILPGQWLTLVGARATGSLVHPSVYGSVLIFSGVILLYAAAQTRSNRARIFYLAVVALVTVALFLSFSRAVWLGTIFVGASLAFFRPRWMARALAAAVIAAVLVSPVVGDVAAFAVQRLTSEESALSRLPVTFAAVRMFEERPLTGWGYGNFDEFDRQFQERVAGFSPTKDHASHNTYLSVLAEQGLIGLVLYLVPPLWWAAATVVAIRRHGPSQRHRVEFLLLLWLILGAHIIIASLSNVRIVYGLGLYWIYLALIATTLDEIGLRDKLGDAVRMPSLDRSVLPGSHGLMRRPERPA